MLIHKHMTCKFLLEWAQLLHPTRSNGREKKINVHAENPFHGLRSAAAYAVLLYSRGSCRNDPVRRPLVPEDLQLDRYAGTNGVG